MKPKKSWFQSINHDEYSNNLIQNDELLMKLSIMPNTNGIFLNTTSALFDIKCWIAGVEMMF